MEFIIIALGLAIRAAVGTYPHSGKGLPPMFGDLEAQRHWMEVTFNLPLSHWYRSTPLNNLQYWGLDYPPLTAFWSLALGFLGSVLGAPQAIAWETSRGAEDPGTLLFLRSTVILADILTYFPAAWLFARTNTGGAQSAAQARIFSALVLLPALLIVDHGHFQYNNVSLGLALLAVAAAAREKYLWAAAAFSCALNYKQMLLYYAPVWFVFLLAESCRHRTPLAARRVFSIGIVVIFVFAVLWLPFCLSMDPLSADESTMARCGSGLHAVLERLFPFSRSLFEDKVANLWCAAEPLLKLRERAYADLTGQSQRIAVGVATAATAALMTPALIGLWALLVAVTQTPITKEHSTVYDTTGAPDVSHAARLNSVAPINKESLRNRKMQASQSSARLESLAVGPVIKVTFLPWEVLLLALYTVSLSFFLASYQVHEKSILLPLLPTVMLLCRLPLLSVWFSCVALWSLWPLLCRDGLVVPMILLGTGYMIFFWPSVEEIAKGDAEILYYAVIRPLQRLASRKREQCRNPQECIPASTADLTSIAWWLQMAAVLSFFPAFAISVGAAILLPPLHLPDLFSFLTAVYSCALLVLAWLYGSCLLLSPCLIVRRLNDGGGVIANIHYCS